MTAATIPPVDQEIPAYQRERPAWDAGRAQNDPSFAEVLRRAGEELGSSLVGWQPLSRPNRWQALRYLVAGARQALPAFLRGLPQGRAPVRPQASRLHPPRRGADIGVAAAAPAPTRPKPVERPAWVEAITPAAPAPPPMVFDRPLTLAEYPQPVDNNGRGIHWIPTTRSSPEVVDRFVEEAKRMGIRWVTFLNDGTRIGDNDYLVKRLVEAGIMPVMRIYTDGGAPIQGDLGALVRHYLKLGVYYFQLYNEPNLRVENGGAEPDVKRYIDRWLPAARIVAANGGLPGFGALSPQGDVDDLTFLREALREIKARGAVDVLNRAWLSVHNYGPDFLRVRKYDAILREELGRSLPQISTEAGVYPGPSLSEEEQVRLLAEAYQYMARREPYYLAYTYWIIANQAGGGHDPAWEYQALFRADGRVSPLVEILRATA